MHNWQDLASSLSVFGTGLLLVGVGLVMVFSASAIMSEERFGSAYLFVRKQLAWDVLGLIAMLICLSTTEQQIKFYFKKIQYMYNLIL